MNTKDTLNRIDAIRHGGGDPSERLAKLTEAVKGWTGPDAEEWETIRQEAANSPEVRTIRKETRELEAVRDALEGRNRYETGGGALHAIRKGAPS